MLFDEMFSFIINVPMPNSFAFSSAAAAAILAASRESVGRLFVADMLMDVKEVGIDQWIPSGKCRWVWKYSCSQWWI